MKGQIDRMKIFSKQIEKANEKECDMIILGDVNLCTTKWKNEDFTYKTVANILINTLTQQGLEVRDVGPTYYSDHIQRNGLICTLFLFCY